LRRAIFSVLRPRSDIGGSVLPGFGTRSI
jgi:hypothetical protein